ncbi:MAG: metallophosphoesterase [Balneolaceae bacterium]|nr:MAG: metallophosphoesterase [Balneolaceae bacterium]
MLKIGLLSDTHNYLDPAVKEHFSDRDEIWHAGDFGSVKIADELEEIAPLKGVYGNIDGQDIRNRFPLHLRFNSGGVDVWMTHIGGIPGRYCIPIRDELTTNPPSLFICGHSHILKVSRDKELGNMIFINPGAAGRQGFQQNRTILRFSVDQGVLKNMEVILLD